MKLIIINIYHINIFIFISEIKNKIINIKIKEINKNLNYLFASNKMKAIQIFFTFICIALSLRLKIERIRQEIPKLQKTLKHKSKSHKLIKSPLES
jgi:hypothetical protein